MARLKQKYVLLIALIIFTACGSSDKRGAEVSDSINSNVDTVASIGTNSTSADLNKEKTIEVPVDIAELKRSPFLSVTSGVLPYSESKAFCQPQKHSFFGHYQLIDKSDDQLGLMGRLIVSVPNKTKKWSYESTDETFVEIKLASKKIKVWKEIGIGTKEDQLNSFIGDSFHYKKGTMIYAVLGDYTLNATILVDTIHELTVGKYCK